MWWLRCLWWLCVRLWRVSAWVGCLWGRCHYDLRLHWVLLWWHGWLWHLLGCLRGRLGCLRLCCACGIEQSPLEVVAVRSAVEEREAGIVLLLLPAEARQAAFLANRAGLMRARAALWCRVCLT